MSNVLDNSLWQYAKENTMNFIKMLSLAVENLPNSKYQLASSPGTDGSDPSTLPRVEALVYVLEKLKSWTLEYDPGDYQRIRFGNEGFRRWHNFVESVCDETLSSIGISEDKYGSSTFMHVKRSFLTCFGNSTRLDYGTGHELEFIRFCMYLFKLEYLTEADLPALVTLVMSRYFQFIRHLLDRYTLEPAGSKGSWGIDPYQFFPFLLGSSQLISNEEISPQDSLVPQKVQEKADDYIYMAAMQYTIKMARDMPLDISCPMLVSIATLCSWTRIHEGLLKMYENEVVNRFKNVSF